MQKLWDKFGGADLNSVFDAFEVDETEAARHARRLIVHYLNVLDRTEPIEEVSQVPLARVQIHPEHPQASRWRRILPRPHVPLPLVPSRRTRTVPVAAGWRRPWRSAANIRLDSDSSSAQLKIRNLQLYNFSTVSYLNLVLEQQNTSFIIILCRIYME